jgi:hypothetical protein
VNGLFHPPRVRTADDRLTRQRARQHTPTCCICRRPAPGLGTASLD